VSHWVFLKTTNARILHECGARWRQIDLIGLRPALPILFSKKQAILRIKASHH